MELATLRDDVVFKVGRNVLLFQELERTLKWITPRLNISGNTPTEMSLSFQKRKDSASKRTLGMNAGELLNSGESVTPSHRLSFATSMALAPATRAEIEKLIEDRNQLIHHFFDGVDPESCESWQTAAKRLDSQRDRLVEVTRLMRDMAEGMSEGHKFLIQETVDDLENKT
ncbi:hypothetical protein [Congregibacter sp.]|uniref:hypothetical protein n=1 Tax=Congregibacter sp. TaxID=2744308 RepID=UPI0039E3DB13